MKPLDSFEVCLATAKLLNAHWEDLSVRSASRYVSPDSVVTLTRSGKPDKRSSIEVFVLTIGKPNFRGRQWVAIRKKSGKAFPLGELQVRRWPKAK